MPLNLLGTIHLGDSFSLAITDTITLACFGLILSVLCIYIPLLLGVSAARKRMSELVTTYCDAARARESERLPERPSDRIGLLVYLALKEFDDRLVQVGKKTRRGLSGQEVLDSERIAQEVELGIFSYDIVRLGPAVLTALGLLGTFFGITSGLGAISDIEVQGTGSILSVVSQVVKGLSTAFWTSIAGVVAALVVMWWSRAAEHRLDIAVESAVESLDLAFPLVTPEQLSRRAQKVARRKLRELEDQSSHLTSLLATQNKGAETLYDVARQAARSATASETIVEQMKRLTEDTADSRSHLQTMVDDLARAFTTSFENTMSPQLERMVTSIQEQLSRVASSGSDTARQFAEDLITNVSKDLGLAFAGMSNSVGQFQAGFDQMMTQVQESVASQSAVVQAGLAATESAQQATIAASREIARVEGAIADTTTVVTRLGELGTDFGELVANVGRAGETYQTAAAGLGEFAQSFSEHARSVYQAVAGLGQVVTLAASKLESTLSKIDERLVAERELADRYANAGADVRGVVEAARPTFAQLQQGAKSLGDVATALGKIGQALATAPEKFGQMTDALNDSSAQLKDAAEAVGEVSGSMEAWRDDATAAINAFNEGLQGALRGTLALYDESLRHAVDSISSAMEELEELIERGRTVQAASA